MLQPLQNLTQIKYSGTADRNITDVNSIRAHVCVQFQNVTPRLKSQKKKRKKKLQIREKKVRILGRNMFLLFHES